MAFMQCNFYSNSLNLWVSMDVILPQPPLACCRADGNIRCSGCFTACPTITPPGSAVLRSSVMSPLQLAVVMPAVDRSFYADMVHGNRDRSYVADELPDVARSFFPLSTRREDNFVAGLSMGGYGAFKLAFSFPRRFSAAASLSGALIDFSQAPVDNPDPDLVVELENIFGDLSKFPGSRHDLYALSRRLARSKREQLAGVVSMLRH